jgi:hypothetical protein
MAYGIQIFRPNGAIAFDSTQATGGVCLGVYQVSSGQVITFPDITGATGIAINCSGAGVLSYTTNSVLGYLQFTIGPGMDGQVLALFAK